MKITPPILVAADASATSDEAVLQADARALTTGADVVFCTVVQHPIPFDPITPSSVVPFDGDAFCASVEAGLRRRVADLTRRPAETIAVRVLTGPPHAAIVSEAERMGAGLIVLGSHGHSGMARVLLGSVAERVARYATCSVLIARPRPLTGCVLVATDFSDPALPALRAAVAEAKRVGGRITAVHAIDPSELEWSGPFGSTAGTMALAHEARLALRNQANERLATALSSLQVQGETVALEGPPATAIVDVARERQAEVVIVGTQGRTGLSRVILGSVAEAVVRHANTSVLVVRLGAATADA